MIRIEVNIDDDQLMDTAWPPWPGRARTPPVIRGLAGVMSAAAEDAFDLERAPVTGAAWLPLNAVYLKKCYEEGYPGKMQQHLSVRYGKDFTLVGVNAPDAAAH